MTNNEPKQFDPAYGDAADATFGRFMPGIQAKTAWWLATTKMLSRPARKWFRKRLARRFPGPFDIVVEGTKLRAWPKENRCDRVAVGRGVLPEAAERRLIAPLLKPDMRFVDIGANIGVYSLFVASQTGDNAKILSLEPHPRTFAKLVCNRRLNGFGSIRPVNLAAAPSETEMMLFSDGGGNIGGASLLAEAAGGATSVAVKAKPLPEILDEYGFDRIDLLKADVEGFEDDALWPLFAESILEPLWPTALLIETVHRPLWRNDLIAELRAKGYSVVGQTAENMLLQR